MKRTFLPLSLVVLLSLAGHAALAGGMAGVGDGGLKSDLETLAAAGVTDNLTMAWPMPWTSVARNLSGQPAFVRDAANRLAGAAAQGRAGGFGATFMASTQPAVIRGFDARADSAMTGQLLAEHRWGGTTIHLALGARSTTATDKQIYTLDGSYVDQRLGPVVIYAGWKPHWWGPGRFSALSLSNNARPMPQIGLTRSRTDAFETPWLSWLGPWQAEMFGGVLNGARAEKNTGFVAFRFGFSPVPGLEIGLERLTELCGAGHECRPFSEYFSLETKTYGPNVSNDQGNFDIRYSGMFGHIGYSLYTQLMSEDTNPFMHSGTSHLFGGALWTGMTGGTGRFTVEYADSVATRDIWGGGVFSGFAYNHTVYRDGWRYRGRSLGFSLDSNSRLLSFEGQYIRYGGDSYSLAFHHAEINIGGLAANAQYRNVVSAAPVIRNMLELRGLWALKRHRLPIRFTLSARIADDQPRPEHGWSGAMDAALTFSL